MESAIDEFCVLQGLAKCDRPYANAITEQLRGFEGKLSKDSCHYFFGTIKNEKTRNSLCPIIFIFLKMSRILTNHNHHVVRSRLSGNPVS